MFSSSDIALFLHIWINWGSFFSSSFTISISCSTIVSFCSSDSCSITAVFISSVGFVTNSFIATFLILSSFFNCSTVLFPSTVAPFKIFTFVCNLFSRYSCIWGWIFNNSVLFIQTFAFTLYSCFFVSKTTGTKQKCMCGLVSSKWT